MSSKDPVARTALSLSISLIGFLVEEGIMTKAQAERFVTRMISTMREAGSPDEAAIALLSQVQKFVQTLKEPTKN